LYNYAPALGSNPADLSNYETYQWTIKGNTYPTGDTDDSNQWYAAMCTWDYSTGKWTILRIVGVAESIQLYDFKYDDVPQSAISTENQQVFSAIVRNSSSKPSESSPTQAFSLEQSYSWGVDIGAKVGVSVTATTGIPFVAQGEVTVSVESSFNWNTQTVNTKTQTVSLTQTMEVEPNSQNTIKFQSMIGQVSNLRYNAKCKVLCRGNESFESPNRDIQGEYTGAVSNRIMVDVGASQPLTNNSNDDKMMMAMTDQDGSNVIHHVYDIHDTIHVIADDGNTTMVSAKPAGFAVDPDTIYWYYVDENSKVHPISGGI
jgi:hypothetical protein